MNPTPTYIDPQPDRSGLKTALVTGALIALVAANVYMYVQIGHVQTDMANMRQGLATELASIRDASSVNSASQARHVEALKEELEAARNQARTLSSQAKADATARAEQLAKQLQTAQAAEQQRINLELSGVKQAADATNTKVGAVTADVGTVKTQLGSTQAELQKTISQLKSVQGDMGVQSGLIATNANQLEALKRLGERNYFEFKLGKTKKPQRVGDITLLLKKTDPKKNRYSVDVMADDKLTEKKDRNINEPVQFYTSKAKQPYELVVNQVQKNLIVGYLATPKELAAR